MRQVADKADRNLKLLTILTIICAAFLVFSIGTVRTKCISKGYELSRLTDTLEERRISIERIEADRSAMVSKEKLYPIAAERGFILRQEGKTFNVQ
ncbi:MAG: hypothetical protein LBV09_04925 [Deferribacteraceae bacterium]|jgi:cell division protein FtsL|nr:hypothetical protein [Deferribacteraceae bacterium]